MDLVTTANPKLWEQGTNLESNVTCGERWKKGAGAVQSTERRFHVCHPVWGKWSVNSRERKGIEGQWRMKILGNEHKTAIDQWQAEKLWTRVRHHPEYLCLWQSNVHDVRLASRFAVFKPRKDDLVASNLAVLLPLQGRLPGDPDRCGVYGLNLQLPGGCSWHWRAGKKGGKAEWARVRKKERDRRQNMLSWWFSSVHCVLRWGAKNYQNNDSWVFYRLGCSVEGSDTRFSHESKSCLLSLDPPLLLCPQNTLYGTACGPEMSVMPLILVWN